jgi:uncharacterized protein (DUF488 family)
MVIGMRIGSRQALGMNKHAHSLQLYTIGHSNRSLDDFVDLLTLYRIETLVDIRSRPGSRKHPHFNQDSFQASLRQHSIEYVWMPSLGGLRSRRKGFVSPNTGLTSLGFRNYADYMGSAEFRQGVAELLNLAYQTTVACMCAEALYRHCHRGLLSDYLLAHGSSVVHILDADQLHRHELGSGAVVTHEGLVVYPPRECQESLFIEDDSLNCSNRLQEKRG